MTIGPISYPARIPIQNNFSNINMHTVAAVQKNDQESIFLTPNGNKASKQVAFGEYEQKIAAQNNLVKRHEEAHLAFSGSQASGSPVYETTTDKDGRLIITGGHQNIKMPEPVDKNASLQSINQTITAAQLVNKGALAPQSFDELSSADKKVASQSAQILAQAETAKAERLLLQQQQGIKSDERLSPDKLAQNKQNKTNSAQEKQAFTGQKLNLIA